MNEFQIGDVVWLKSSKNPSLAAASNTSQKFVVFVYRETTMTAYELCLNGTRSTDEYDTRATNLRNQKLVQSVYEARWRR